MTWHWRPVEACDLDQAVDAINPQMKTLDRALNADRPEIMVVYPKHSGMIVSNTLVSHTGDTDEYELKSTDLGRGTISSTGGIRLTILGTCTGSAGAKTVRVKWCGLTIGTLSLATGTTKWALMVEIFNLGSTYSQRWWVRGWDATTMELMDSGSDNVETR